MHELGLCEGVLDAVLSRSAGRRVTGVRVRVGETHRHGAAFVDVFDQTFSMLAAGTDAAGARVDLVAVPGDELTLESISLAGG